MKNSKKILTVALIIAFALVALIPLTGGFATSKSSLLYGRILLRMR